MGEVFGQNRNGLRAALGSEPRSLQIEFANQITEEGMASSISGRPTSSERGRPLPMISCRHPAGYPTIVCQMIS